MSNCFYISSGKLSVLTTSINGLTVDIYRPHGDFYKAVIAIGMNPVTLYLLEYMTFIKGNVIAFVLRHSIEAFPTCVVAFSGNNNSL